MKRIQHGGKLLAATTLSWLLLSSCSTTPTPQTNANNTSKSARAHDLLIGQWHCRYQKKISANLLLNAESIDEYRADGSVTSDGLLSLQDPQHPQNSVDYKLQTQSQWTMQPQLLNLTQVQLSSFEVSNPEFENNLQFKQQLQQVQSVQAQIVQLTPQQLQLKMLDNTNPNQAEIACNRA